MKDHVLGEWKRFWNAGVEKQRLWKKILTHQNILCLVLKAERETLM